VFVCNAIQTMPLRYFCGSAISLSRKTFFSLYSRLIPKFSMPYESYENVDSAVPNDLELKGCLKLTECLTELAVSVCNAIQTVSL